MKENYNPDVLEKIRLKLLANAKTVSVAESVTSGHLQVAFSQAKDASSFFQGGITVYNSGQKTRHLNIEPIGASKTNCVDQSVANQMAINANAFFLSDYSIGITGYAAAVPEINVIDLYAYLSIAFRQEIILELRLTADANKDSFQVQLQYTCEALAQMEAVLR